MQIVINQTWSSFTVVKRPKVLTDQEQSYGKYCLFVRHVRGQKFHSSARIYKWILERTSDSSQSARLTGRVLKSVGETSIFWMAGSVFIEPNIFSILKVETGCCDCKWQIKAAQYNVRYCGRLLIFSERIFINVIGLYSDRLYRCNYIEFSSW